MDSNNVGLPLTDNIKYETSQKVERKPTIDKKDLKDFSSEIANMLDLNSFMEYQIKSWNYIESRFNGKNSKNLIVDAGTGFGKTEAVIPAVIRKILDEDSLAILIFPRRALLIDQIQRIINYKIDKELRIGIQISGVSPEIEWTVYNNDQKNAYIQTKSKKMKMKDINFISHTNYHFETDIFDVDYKNENLDNVQINLFKCNCGGSFENFASFQADMTRGYPKHKKFVGMNHHNSYWQCNKCGKVINFAFSRSDQISLKPNILLTTIDSLLSLISDPDMGDYMKNKLRSVVFDEVHVYNSSYGGHAAEIIAKINEVTKRNIFLAGLSATIDMPEVFGSKLFRSDVEVIEPTVNDINRIEDKEKYIFIKSSNKENESGDTYPLKTQNMIQTTLLIASSLDKKLMAFMDSVDAVVSLARQATDAYNSKKLYDFRLDGLLSGTENYVGLKCNGFSDNCNLTCGIYDRGECWNILRGPSRINKTPASIDIKGVHSEALISRTELQAAKIIFSTSELQLGIDLPDVEYLLQYGTPYTIFDYIQRKGRAGRSTGSEPLFLFVLGESSNDYVYFSYGSSILNKKYILPLEEKNEVVDKLYRRLFDYYNGTSKEYNAIKSNYGNDKEYIPKFIASWLALFNGFGLDSDFADFLRTNFNASSSSISSITNYIDMKNFKNSNAQKTQTLIDNYKTQLTTLLAPLNNELPSQMLQTETQAIIDELTNYPKIKQSNIKSIECLRDKIIEDIESNKNSSQNEAQLFSQLNNLINQGLFGTPLGNKVSDLSNKLVHHATAKNSNSKDIQQKARELFFIIQSLKELKMAFNRTLTSEVIKYMLRANYFYMIPRLLTNSVMVSLPVIPPVNMFSISSREIPLTGVTGYENNNKNIDIRDAIFKYFPFRLNTTRSFNSKMIVNPSIKVENGKLYFYPEEIIDPIRFTYSKNKYAMMPLSLKITDISDDGINGIISYCKNCRSFYDYYKNKCSKCNADLSKVSLYATNKYENNITVKTWDPVINQISLSEVSEVTTLLKGVDLSINYQYWNEEDNRYYPSKNRETLEVESKLPYGYQVTTHSLKIDINQKLLESLYDKFNKWYPNRIGKEGFSMNDILHTLAHLWLKTIAISVGISPDQFSYEYGDGSVIVSELQEGGAGYLKAFIQYLKFRTKDVAEIMNNIVHCEEHDSIFSNQNKKQVYEEFKNIDFNKIYLYQHQKIIDQIMAKDTSLLDSPDDYPVCYDGCLYCIGLTSCKIGGDYQFDHLSLSVALEYVTSLVKVTNDKEDAASMVAEGGIIISRKGDEYSIFNL